jgi:hypothetical protein
MKQKQKKIQVFLLVIGFFLILFTYFYYPYMNRNKSLVEKNTQEDLLPAFDEKSKDTTSFGNIEYRGLYDLDKTFIVKSEKANIDNVDPDIVHMTNMHVILYLKDGRIVNILSNKGKYNKANYDCFFEKNVSATDGETKIFSDNLDLLGNESSVKIYNNVSINYPTGSSLQADKVDYDFETKYFKISMFDDKRIKMKIFK